MGKLEKEVKQKRKRENIQKILLDVIATGGFLAMGVILPNAMTLLKLIEGDKQRKKNPKYSINNAIKRLKEKKFIKFEKTPKGTFVRLTSKGNEYLRMLGDYSSAVRKPKKWDGKWRIIIFDIMEFQRGIRDKFRKTLKNIGFIQLQRSVWVFPYDCEDLIILLKSDFKIGKDILYIIAEKIENDRLLKKIFNLE